MREDKNLTCIVEQKEPSSFFYRVMLNNDMIACGYDCVLVSKLAALRLEDIIQNSLERVEEHAGN